MKRILCLGDSNTWGYDPRSYLGSRYPADVRWTGLLSRTGWDVRNEGCCGMTVPREAELPEPAWLRRGGPWDAAAVMLGTNDLLQGIPAETAAARMEGLLRRAAEAAPEARLLLIAPPPPAGQPPTETEAGRLAALYGALARRLGCAFADAGDWGVELSYDGVHFSPAGHAAFARRLGGLLEEGL